MQPKKPIVRADARKLDLARIHMLKAELGWHEGLYRDVMAAVCNGITSSAELDMAGRQRLIAHMQASKARDTGDRGAKGPKPARAPLSPTGRKLWSLWMQAADKGLVHQRSMVALNTWIKRQTGVDRHEWLSTDQADLAIESLKLWIKRGGEA